MSTRTSVPGTNEFHYAGCLYDVIDCSKVGLNGSVHVFVFHCIIIKVVRSIHLPARPIFNALVGQTHASERIGRELLRVYSLRTCPGVFNPSSPPTYQNIAMKSRCVRINTSTRMSFSSSLNESSHLCTLNRPAGTCRRQIRHAVSHTHLTAYVQYTQVKCCT